MFSAQIEKGKWNMEAIDILRNVFTTTLKKPRPVCLPFQILEFSSLQTDLSSSSNKTGQEKPTPGKRGTAIIYETKTTFCR